MKKRKTKTIETKAFFIITYFNAHREKERAKSLTSSASYEANRNFITGKDNERNEEEEEEEGKALTVTEKLNFDVSKVGVETWRQIKRHDIYCRFFFITGSLPTFLVVHSLKDLFDKGDKFSFSPSVSPYNRFRPYIFSNVDSAFYFCRLKWLLFFPKW